MERVFGRPKEAHCPADVRAVNQFAGLIFAIGDGPSAIVTAAFFAAVT